LNKELIDFIASLSRGILPIDQYAIFPPSRCSGQDHPLFHYSNWGGAPKFSYFYYVGLSRKLAIILEAFGSVNLQVSSSKVVLSVK